MKFIEDRPLSRIELNFLLAEANETEVRNLINFLRHINEDAFDFFNKNSVYKFGLIINQRPIYFAYITNLDDKYELFTVVNTDVKEQFSLYKYSKRSLRHALNEFGPIYATMERHALKNIAWTKHMGFKQMSEDENTVTLKIEK